MEMRVFNGLEDVPRSWPLDFVAAAFLKQQDPAAPEEPPEQAVRRWLTSPAGFGVSSFDEDDLAPLVAAVENRRQVALDAAKLAGDLDALYAGREPQ